MRVKNYQRHARKKVFQWKRGGLLFPQMPVCNQHTLSRYVLLSKARVFYLFSDNNSMTNPSFSQIVPNFCSETLVRGKTVLLTLLKSEPSIASNWRCVPALRNHICHTTKEINFQKLKGKIKLSQIKMWRGEVLQSKIDLQNHLNAGANKKYPVWHPFVYLS